MIQITHESHEAPAHIAAALKRAGGVNCFGEPNFRAVWGWNRLGWIGGRWTDLNSTGAVAREVIELRYTQKYSAHNRWHIERWCAPEMYGTPENWAKQTLEIEDGRNISALGPFPGARRIRARVHAGKKFADGSHARRFRAAHSDNRGTFVPHDRSQQKQTAAAEQGIAVPAGRSEGSGIRFVGGSGIGWVEKAMRYLVMSLIPATIAAAIEPITIPKKIRQRTSNGRSRKKTGTGEERNIATTHTMCAPCATLVRVRSPARKPSKKYVTAIEATAVCQIKTSNA